MTDAKEKLITSKIAMLITATRAGKIRWTLTSFGEDNFKAMYPCKLSYAYLFAIREVTTEKGYKRDARDYVFVTRDIEKEQYFISLRCDTIVIDVVHEFELTNKSLLKDLFSLAEQNSVEVWNNIGESTNEYI